MSEFHYKKKGLKPSVQQLNFFAGLLDEGYDLRLKVTGRSMLPFLEAGSYVILSKIPVSGIKVGDIIFCQCDDGSFKLHRLIQMTHKKLVTKGDALASYDVPFRKTDYKGKVIRIEHHLVNGVNHRNMDNQSTRVFNYLIARYYQLKLFFICLYFRLKSNPA